MYQIMLNFEARTARRVTYSCSAVQALCPPPAPPFVLSDRPARVYLPTLVRFLSYLYILIDNDIGISAFRPLLLWEPRLQSRVLLAGSEGPKESKLWSRLLLRTFDRCCMS